MWIVIAIIIHIKTRVKRAIGAVARGKSCCKKMKSEYLGSDTFLQVIESKIGEFANHGERERTKKN